jgi:hypothetical protein
MTRILVYVCLAVFLFPAMAEAAGAHAPAPNADPAAASSRTVDAAPAGISADPPICGVAPTILDFGTVSVQGYEEQVFEISNLGGGTLTGTVSEACSDYEITVGGGYYSLGPGEFVVVVVRFAPQSSGTKNCEIGTGTACANVFCTGVGEGGGGIDDGSGQEAPGAFVLRRNLPNPFRAETLIIFDLSCDYRVTLTIHSVKGDRISVLADGMMPQGEHRVIWKGVDDQGAEVPPGFYFCRLEAGGCSRTTKMLLLD